MKTETPRTDAAYTANIRLYPQSLTTHDVVSADFARELERENNLLREAAAQADEISNHLDDAINERNELRAENDELKKRMAAMPNIKAEPPPVSGGEAQKEYPNGK
jgi:seryl-tRNA synthetase